jgi:hypothetical protein
VQKYIEVECVLKSPSGECGFKVRLHANDKGNRRGKNPDRQATQFWTGQEHAAEEMANAIVTVAHDCRYKIPIPTELREAGIGRSRF